ncbi:MAG TPA: extracellular solute-binding protein [Patescibacteria group bacterium]|nr:extracellular solute-binding protein [Patescibacteria group bacterium]
MTGGQNVSTRWRSIAAIGAIALIVGACSGGTSSAAPSSASTAAPTSAPASAAASTAAVEIDWYHVQNDDKGKALWQKLADEYMAAHPNVKVNITVLENEAFKTKLTTLLQAKTPPDLFQSWGGGGLREQQEAGLVKDITGDVASWKNEINPGALGMYQVDGKQYGIPFDLGMVGFWYNKEQFAKAGITSPPATWDELLADVGKLKAAGLVPIALAGKDKWPGMFYWALLAVRSCGQDKMNKAVTSGDWTDPCFVEAGNQLKKLIDQKPFQEGFLGAIWDGAGSGAASMATGKGAMQLMGQWLPGTVTNNSADKKGMGDNLGWFPFPALTGAAGAATDGFGGGNGFAVGKDAPPETLDFLHFLVSKDAAMQWGALGTGILPTTVGTESSVTDPQLKDVLAARAKANFVQLYLDQATTPALGGSINDAIQTLYAGTGTPEQVSQAITDAAKTQ